MTQYPHLLPPERLGRVHETLESFRQASKEAPRSKEYSLIVVTAAPRRILLGRKHRGFGQGLFNSFGGKVEPGESPLEGARRELWEETGIRAVRLHPVGVLRFTFDDSDVEMMVHLFHVNIDSTATIRGCDEITPVWFDDWSEIPFSTMFADDSVWLPLLLEGTRYLDGWFHFAAGSTETNTILERCVRTYTLEQRLFHALHQRSQSLSLKEFHEASAFGTALRKTLDPTQVDLIVDVAGGHGALAALLLMRTSAQKAVVVDPHAHVDRIQSVWSDYLQGKELSSKIEPLRTGLPSVLQVATKGISPDRIWVVACHACQHLSDETVSIAQRFGTHVAVLPCCQKLPDTWKSVTSQLSIPVAHTADLLLAGKAMADARYTVRMKVLEQAKTPQNRLIVGRIGRDDKVTTVADDKLTRAYRRAHASMHGDPATRPSWWIAVSGLACVAILAVLAPRPSR